MSNIRVLIRDIPKMLRDILEQEISGEPDMEVMSEPPVPPRAPADTNVSPDVFVVGTSDGEPCERARAVLVRWPRSRVLMITARGDRAVIYELVPQGCDLGELSPSQLVQAIRSAGRSERPSAH